MPHQKKESELEYIEMIVEKAAYAASKQAANDVLTRIGFNITDPNAIQADLQYLRGVRTGCETIKSNTLRIVLASFIPFVIYMFWNGLTDFFKLKLGGS